MNIRLQQYFFMGAMSLAALIIIATLAFTSAAIGTATLLNRHATTVFFAISDLNFLAFEFIQTRHQRPKIQWQNRHASLEKLLEDNQFAGAPWSNELALLRKSVADLKEVFSSLPDSSSESRPVGRDEAMALKVYEERLIERLLWTLRRTESATVQLSKASESALADIQRKSNIAIISALALMFLLVVITSVHTFRSILQPLSRLKNAMQSISAGSRGSRLVNPSPNEIGELAEEFNHMMDQLDESRLALEEKTRQLEAANSELESFSYSVSHDLRVPLRAIDGFSNRLERKYADKLDSEGHRLLGVVRGSAQKMGQLIDDILSFSRMGRKDLSQDGLDMTALAQAAIDELAPDRTMRGPIVRLTVLPPARGDASMLRQVWVNLIGNAIKFSRSRVGACIEISGYAQGNENVYCVKDNGVGFDPAYAGKLFGVFQRLHGVDEFEGTGIGLAIVKRIITRHGGRVWGEGKVDEGATFCFALPAQQGQVQAVPPVQGGAGQTANHSEEKA